MNTRRAEILISTSVDLEDSKLLLAALGREVHHLPRGPGFRICTLAPRAVRSGTGSP